jgi:hypothetical protein
VKEIERAIKHFESLQKRYTTTHNGKHCELVKTALTALREQAEREKGCSMCEHDVMDGNPIVAKHADGYTITTTGVVSFSANLVAKFCPMCGKRLEGKP